ncbi:hypothetical protein [Mesonia maritima]|uniref:Uncharacterized protein n=2 Tax=Mesonia maritima TaxID=1793873 RepID=A0ABU1K7C9_9FLAO|nr:hypothetical protein [Mesonia maritima]MDR6300407.1 hypothetical protein [Mesonia maritima]
MNLEGKLHTFPKALKLLIGTFLIVLSVGYFTGLTFVGETTSNSAKGIQENYLGNENDENAEVMKFKKSEREMLTIVHTHILSMSVIFFLVGGLVYLTKANLSIKKFLMIEPLFSVLLTFGGIYFMWQGFHWMRYIVIFSGILMTLSFTLSVLLIFSQLIKK